jgi:hypothetical protein
MYLGLNGFTGTIPTEIFQLNALGRQQMICARVIILIYIPNKCFIPYMNTEDFSIYNNELSGSIPTIVGQLTKLGKYTLL